MPLKLPRQLIDIINKLNEDELRALHAIVAQRLNLMHTARAMYAMKDLNLLDRVYFWHNGEKIEGVIARLNQKTITVMTEVKGRWNVAPSLLTKLEPDNSTEKNNR